MHVAKGNESMATEEVRQKVKLLADKINHMKTLKQEIIKLAEDSDLWHLDLEFNDLTYYDPVAEHDNWLASNHNC